MLTKKEMNRMKQFIFGFIIGGVVVGGTTYYFTRKETEKKTINDLREELLESCMAEARRTIAKEQPVDDEDLPFEPDNKKDDEVPFEDEESEKASYENITKNYSKYYSTKDTLIEDEESEEDEEPITSDEDFENQNLNALADEGVEMSRKNPHEIITANEYQNSKWDKIYDKETLTYHIPDMCIAEDTGNILGEEDILEMLGPNYQRELAARGKAFIRNHLLQTSYEVYATEVPYADTNQDDDEDYDYDDAE